MQSAPARTAGTGTVSIAPGEPPIFYMVGPGRVGKSTILRLFSLLHGNGFSNARELEQYAEMLKENLMDAMYVVLQNAGFPEDLRLPAEHLEETRNLVRKYFEEGGHSGRPFPPAEAERVRSLLLELTQDPGFRISALRVLQDPKNPAWPGICAVPSAEYLLDHFARITAENFVAVPTDMLHLRIRTTGIFGTTFDSPRFGKLEVIDSGGERSERRKWPMWYQREKASAKRIFPVFVARLDAFGETLFEDDKTDMLKDSVDCWGSILGQPFVQETARPVFLLLTKVDGLRRTLGDGSHLRRVYPGYTGGGDVEAAIAFIRGLFEAVVLANYPQLPVSIHLVDNTDVEGSRPIWDRIISTAMWTLGRMHGGDGSDGPGGPGGPGGPHGLSLASVKVHVRNQVRIERGLRGAPKLEWRVARIFLSSTFADMHGERDQITRLVFPSLQDRCNAIRVTVVEVDLRWGVTAHEADNNEVVEICLREIDRARPFFVGLLGDRYGWIPDSVPDEPFLDWIRAYPPRRSVTEMEMHYGALRDPKACLARFYIRDGSFLRGAPPQEAAKFTEASEHSRAALAALKERVRATFPDRTFDYRCTWAGVREDKAMAGSLEAMGERMLEDLWADVSVHFAAGDDADVGELAPHRRFMELRANKFIGREPLLKQVEALVGRSEGQPCVVVGLPGSGKSSLLAAFCARYAAAHPQEAVVPFFVGTTPTSTALATLLRTVNEALGRGGDGEQAETVEELRAEFGELLKKAAKERPVLIVVDALNQLDAGSGAKWIPAALPAGARLLLSTLEGPMLDALRARDPRPQELLVGPLDVDERRDLVRQTLLPFRKKLSEAHDNDQLGMLVTKRDSNSPLYLSVSCDELRLFGVFERLSQKIASMPDDMAGLLSSVLERLEGFLGQEMVRDSLCAVQCSRGGIPEPDLVAFIGELKAQREGGAGHDAALVANAWARIYLSLQVLLRPVDHAKHNNGVIDFFHRQIAKAVVRRYFGGDFLASEAYTTFNWLLANYYYTRWQAEPTHAKAMRDIVFHATASRHTDLLQKTLVNLSFIECKARAGLIWDLVAEYMALPEDLRAELPNFDDYRAFVASNAALLASKPVLTLPLAVNVAARAGQTESPVAEAARYILTQYARSAYAEWRSPRSGSEPRLLTYTMRPYPDEPVAHIALAQDGTLIGAGENVRVWWDERGGQVRRHLPGLSSQQLAFAPHPSGRYVATAVAGGVMVLDAESTEYARACVPIASVGTRNPKSSFTSLIWSSDGATAAVGTTGDEITIYNTTNPLEWQAVDSLKTVSEADKGFLPLTFSHDKRWLVGYMPGSWMGYLWDLKAQKRSDFRLCVCYLAVKGTYVDSEGNVKTQLVSVHKQRWTSTVFEEGDARFATASVDGLIRVFNVADLTTAPQQAGSENPLETVSTMRHGRPVLALAWTGTGPESRLASMGADGRIVLWEAAGPAGRAVAFLFGVGGPVTHGVFGRGGAHLYTATGPFVQKWDVRLAADAADRAHAGAVTGLSLAPPAAGREPVVVSCALDRPVLAVTAAVPRPGQRPARLELPCGAASEAPVTAVAALSPDAALVGFADGTVALFPTRPAPGGGPAAPLAVARRAHQHPITAAAAGGGVAATGDRGGHVQLWTVAGGALAAAAAQRPHAGAVAALRFGPQGTLASAALDGSACLLATAGGQLREAGRWQAGRPSPVFAAAGPLAGGALVAATGDEVAARAGAGPAAWAAARTRPGDVALAVAVSPDGARVAAVWREKRVSVHDGRTGAALFECPFVSAETAVLEATAADVQWEAAGALRVAFGFSSGAVAAAAVAAPA